MGQKFHFISGLPRAGSTLLAAILRQNPRFHAGMTSPVGALFSQLVGAFSAGSEYASVVSEEKRVSMSRALFLAYYEDQTDKEVIFDTNRLWCSQLPALSRMFPEARVLACVRNVAWTMDSLERQFRKHAFENTRLFNDQTERNTVYSRVDTLGQRNRIVGFAWSALKEAFYSEEADRMLLIEYDILASAPAKVLPLIYEFLGEPGYDHDFDNAGYDEPEFDADLGLTGLHKVRDKVTFEPRKTILPPDLFESYANMSFWTDQAESSANVITAKPAGQSNVPDDDPPESKDRIN